MKNQRSQESNASFVSLEWRLIQTLTGKHKCVHVPSGPVIPGDKVLGTIENHTTRAMYSLWMEMIEEERTFEESMSKSVPKVRNGELCTPKRRLRQFQNRADCIKTLFWELVFSEFPEARDDEIGVSIREDWKVVIFIVVAPLRVRCVMGYTVT